jgi:hypothetical protein
MNEPATPFKRGQLCQARRTWPWGPNHYQLVLPDLIITIEPEREREECSSWLNTYTVEPRERKQGGGHKEEKVSSFSHSEAHRETCCVTICYPHLPVINLLYGVKYTSTRSQTRGPVLMLPSSLLPRTLSCSLSHAMPAGCSLTSQQDKHKHVESAATSYANTGKQVLVLHFVELVIVDNEI